MDGKIVNLKSKIEIYKAMTNGANFADCPVRDVMQGMNGK
ncbi:transcriptional regulator, partial [Mesorhizobium sp. USDA-HM6]